MDGFESVQDVIQNAVQKWASDTDSSLLVNWVFTAEFLEEDGGRSNQVVTPDGTSLASSMGLLRYGENLMDELQRRDLLGVIYGEEE